jgi:CHASE2 domain-containing sensor protein
LDHARMIDRLTTAGVAAVAFDLYIDDENEGERAADAVLADAIRRATQKGVRIIIGIRAATGSVPRMLPALIDAGAEPGSLCIGTRLGYAFSVPIAVSSDSRGVRALRVSNAALGLLAARRGRPETIDEERHEVSVRDGTNTRFVAYSVLENATAPANDCPTLGAGSVVASLLLRLSPSGFWREPLRHMSYAQVLDPATPSSHPDVLRGKIALIGVTLAEVGDSHSVVHGWKREQIFGVELHADTIASIERGTAVRPVGPIAQYLFMLALAAVGAATSFLLFDRAAGYRRASLGFALAAYLGLGVLFYVTLGILFNVLYDITAFAAAYVVLSHLQKKAVAEPVEEV